jgi:streptogramin lyase
MKHSRRWLTVLLGTAIAALTLVSYSGATGGRLVLKTSAYPIWAAYADGSVWVGTHHTTTVYRINPATGRITRRIADSKTPCGMPAAGFASLFVPDCIDEGGTTVQISTRTNKPVRELPGGSPVVGFGSVWTLNPSGRIVYRLDPRSGVVLARIATNLNEGAGGGQESLGAAGAGSIWLGSQTTKTVLRISAASNKVTDVITLPGGAASPTSAQGYAGGGPMAFAGGKIWYGNPAGVFEVDPASNTATLLPISIGALDGWGDIAFATGLGSVWVRTSGSQVTRIDPSTGKATGTYPATGGGGGLAVVGNYLWVANALTDTTWRERTGAAQGRAEFAARATVRPVPLALRGTWTASIDLQAMATIQQYAPDFDQQGNWTLTLTRTTFQLRNPQGYSAGSSRAYKVAPGVVHVANDPDCPGETSPQGGMYRFRIVGRTLTLRPTQVDACVSRQWLLEVRPWHRQR